MMNQIMIVSQEVSSTVSPDGEKFRYAQDVCVCVCVFSSHLFWTSGLWKYQPGSHKRKVTQDFSSTFLLRCLP